MEIPIASQGKISKSHIKAHFSIFQPTYPHISMKLLDILCRVMVIFIVDFEDESERALARLFLQQFAVAQKQISHGPHCEFRRGNDPKKEVLQILESHPGAQPTGYLSFTFFQSHVKTEAMRRKVVEKMVNFMPYLDKHIKSTKSYMHSRMRGKKSDLLTELREVNQKASVEKLVSSKTRKMIQGKTPACFGQHHQRRN